MNKVEVDEVEYMEIKKQLEIQQKLLNSINIKLDKLVNQRTAQKIGDTLKEEDKIMEATTKLFNKTVQEKLEKTEEVLMDLSRVTIMVITKRAVLVAKEGKQKWIPISTLQDKYVDTKNLNDEDQKFDYTLKDWEIKEGTFFADKLILKDSGKWIDNKSWDKLEVRKK